MGWTEGVLVAALVIVRLYSLGLEQLRARIVASREEGEDPLAVTQRWLRYLVFSSVGAALLLGTSAFLAAAGAGRFGAGVRVGVVLWASELLVHAGGLVGFVRHLRAGSPVTPDLAFSQPAACWTSTVLSVPAGALLGSWLAG
jgi:hypothetical protein